MQPILIYVRELIHVASLQVVVSIKWGMPSFDYKGPLIVMGALKNHMVINFRKAQLMADSENIFVKSGQSMVTFGKINSIKQSPPRETLLAFIFEAIDLNEKGIKITKEKRSKLQRSFPFLKIS